MVHPIARAVDYLQRVIGRSVFLPIAKGSTMESILSVMFHRVSATLYFAYSVWAVVSVIAGIPSLIAANGEQWQTIFSIAVLICALPSCFGATFWPSFARLELFAGAAFSTLLAIYLFYLTGNALFNGGAWAGVVLLTTVLVVPFCRLIIIIMFLLRQAEDRKKRMELYREWVHAQVTEAE